MIMYCGAVIKKVCSEYTDLEDLDLFISLLCYWGLVRDL